MDLRKRYKDLTEGKNIDSNDSKKLQRLEVALAKTQREVGDVDYELHHLKTVISKKDEELEQLRQAHAVREADNLKCLQDNRVIENELLQYKKTALLSDNQFNDEVINMQRRAKEAEEEVKSIRQKVQELENRLEEARRPYTLHKAFFNTKDKEVNDLTQANMKLETEVRILMEKAESLEDKVERKKQIFKDNSNLLESYYKELKHLNFILRNADNGVIESNKQLKEVKGGNKTLKQSLEKHKKDADLLKQEFEKMCEQKVLTELDHRGLIRAKANNEVAAQMANEELKEMRAANTKLLGERIEMHEELNALMQHKELLQTQNAKMQDELDKFNETDEIVRKDLDRKSRVQFMKNRNEEEIMESIRKVRDSVSGKRDYTHNKQSVE